MARTLLQLVNDACNELGLPTFTVIISSIDPQVAQWLALFQRDGRELRKDKDWTCLQTQKIVSIIAPTTTTGNVMLNSAVITAIPSTAGITANTFVCTGNGIPVAARVASVDSATQVTLDMLATGSGTAVSLTFAQDTYSGPTDFDRFINQTGWDRTNRWQLLGPDSPQEDQWHRSGVVTVGPRRHYRVIGIAPNNYRIWPPPSSTDTPFQLVYEYISKNWIALSGVTTNLSDRFANDTDTVLFDEDMLVLGAKWRLLQVKGMEYGPQQQEYLDYVDRTFAQDGGAKVLNLSANVAPYLSPAIVRDGSYPGFIGPNMS